MKTLLFAAALVVAMSACARNKSSEAAGARIHDTTLTPRDTVNPSDTLPHIRDSASDSTR